LQTSKLVSLEAKQTYRYQKFVHFDPNKYKSHHSGDQLNITSKKE
jgi:hypothetical protein